MPPKIIELRPDPRLLEPDFNGYKLSLNPIPTSELELISEVDRALPNLQQYSLLHAKLFGLHNHLVGETRDGCDSVYFVDKYFNVNKASIDQDTHEFSEITIVWNIPLKERVKRYNVSLKFASAGLAVISDGMGVLHLLETGDRQQNDAWNCVFSDSVLPVKDDFAIQDVILKDDSLDCLLLSIKQSEELERSSSVLFWITFKKSQSKWSQVALRQLVSKGGLHYCSFESNCDSIYVISDALFEFTLDSENPVVAKPKPAGIKKYMWLQDEGSITVKFKLPEGFLRHDLHIQTTNEDIFVKYKDFEVLCGKFLNCVDSDQTKWSVEENGSTVEIILAKLEKGLMWPTVLSNCDDGGEFVADEKLAGEIHERLAHLCCDFEDKPEVGQTFNSEAVEECDFEEDKRYTFQRLSKFSHETTHSANIPGHQVVLVAKLGSGVPAFALRHDVDACLWLPEVENNEFAIRHVGTLLAFGYVQASKQQRKFSICSPDLSYTVICETARHIFIYRQNTAVTSGELRNRTTGRRIGTVAQQQVVNITNDEVLGIYGSQNTLFILTKNKLYALKLS